MRRKILAPAGLWGAVLALGALTMPGPMADVYAQETRPRVRVEREDCRCVDRDGKPIERCTCFTMPDVDRIVTTALAGIRGRARLGITLASGGDESRGARVNSVLKEGPADQAGIREGDVITSLNGKNLLQPLPPEAEGKLDEDGPLPLQRLMALVQEIEPGEAVTVEYLRGQDRLTATLEARDLDPASYAFSMALPEHLDALRLRAPRAPMEMQIWTDSMESPRGFPGEPGRNMFLFRGEEGPGALLRDCPGEPGGDRGFRVYFDRCVGGLEVTGLKPGLADYFGTSRGVLVTDVHPDSKLGIQAGDVVLAVGDREATSPDRLRRILESYAGDETISLRIMRQKREMTVQGTLGR